MTDNQLTRGGLKPAKLIRLKNSDKPEFAVDCMFNPHEYTLTKQNQWQDQAVRGKNTGSPSFVKGGSQTLKLTLYFDTTLQNNADVRQYTDKLWEMMKVVPEKKKGKETEQGKPSNVVFQWGSFYFKAVLTSMTQKFTLFTSTGVPIRCQVDVTLEQKVDIDDYRAETGDVPLPNGADTVITAIAGDRPDNIAAGQGEEGLDTLVPKLIAKAMRKIAEDNNIDDPLNIPPGRLLNR